MSTLSKMYLWRDQGLFLTACPTETKTFIAGSDQLFVCLEGTMTRHFPGKKPVTFRSSLVKAGAKITMETIEANWQKLAILHLRPAHQDYFACREQMLANTEGTYFHHCKETELIDSLNAVFDQNFSPAQTQQLLRPFVFASATHSKTFKKFDARILAVKQYLEENIRSNLKIRALAERMHLSESRLVKLFRQQLGVPITRYRIQYRVHVGLVYITLGYSVTEAAMGSGFANTAHFSRCFSEVFGVPPSSNYLQPPFLEVKLDPEIVALIRQRANQEATLLHNTAAAISRGHSNLAAG